MPYVKDGIERFIIHGEAGCVNEGQTGTKAAVCYSREVPPGGSVSVRLRLVEDISSTDLLGGGFEEVFAQRLAEADEFYETVVGQCTTADARNVQRQAFAGVLWS